MSGLRVRPSALQLAEKCAESAYLGAEYPEGNAATEQGNAVDAEVTAALNGAPGTPSRPEAIAIVEWVTSWVPPGSKTWVQEKVQLHDPETGELLTEGTPDFVALVDGVLTVCDWKKAGQIYAGYLPAPGENLQLLAYMVAYALKTNASVGRVIAVGFREDGKLLPIVSDVISATDWWPVIERIKAINAKPRQAVTGEHCDRCWHRMHCKAHLLPAVQGAPVELQPFMEGGELTTNAQALAGLEWLDKADTAIKRAKEVRERVNGQIEAFARRSGGIPSADGGRVFKEVITPGRRSGPSVADLEKMGRTDLIKTGKPSSKFDWRPAGGR